VEINYYQLNSSADSGCLFFGHRAASPVSQGFVGLVRGLVHKVIHKNWGVARKKFVLGKKP
jgi:hypothetical protein